MNNRLFKHLFFFFISVSSISLINATKLVVKNESSKKVTFSLAGSFKYINRKILQSKEAYEIESSSLDSTIIVSSIKYFFDDNEKSTITQKFAHENSFQMVTIPKDKYATIIIDDNGVRNTSLEFKIDDSSTKFFSKDSFNNKFIKAKDFGFKVAGKISKPFCKAANSFLDKKESIKNTIQFLRGKQVFPSRLPYIDSKNEYLNDLRYEDKKNKCKKEITSVRIEGSIACEEEKKAIENRESKVREKQEKFLNVKFSEDEPTLSVGFVGSGGGIRARLATAGFTVGAKRIGLLDCATYFSALSGSTWMLAPWLYSGQNIYDFRNTILKDCRECTGNYVTFAVKKCKMSILKTMSKFIGSNKSCSVVNVFSAILPKMLLENVKRIRSSNRFKKITECYLDDVDIEKNIRLGNNIIPIFEARAEEDTSGIKKICHFTPWEFGSRFFGNNGAYIPLFAFNRKFQNGISIDKNCQPTLSFLMSIWGSAFTASKKTILEGSIWFRNYVKKNFSSSAYSQDANLKIGSVPKRHGNLSFTTSKVKNFMHGLNVECGNFYKNEDLNLFDSGVEINLPILSLYRRTKNNNIKLKEGSPPEVIIIFDSSDDSIGVQLLRAQNEIKKINKMENKNLPFPKLPSQEKIAKTMKKYGMCIFKDNPDVTKYNDYEIPVVIYMALVNSFKEENKKLKNFTYNAENFGTFNIHYKEELADKFMEMTENNISMELSKKQIQIAMIIARKRNLIRKRGDEACALDKFKELSGKQRSLALSIMKLKLICYKKRKEANSNNLYFIKHADENLKLNNKIKTLEQLYNMQNNQNNSANLSLINFAKTKIDRQFWGKYKQFIPGILKYKNIDINKKDSHGETALIWASYKNNIGLVDLLLDNENININEKNAKGHTALMVASYKNNIEIVNLLLDREDININEKSNKGSAALNLASDKNNTEIVKLLTGYKKTKINEKDFVIVHNILI